MPAGKRLRSRDDWHDPFSRGMADADVVQECCRENCHMVMARKNIQCDAGSEVRGYDDWRMPFGNDWSQSAATIKSQCCLQQCNTLQCPTSTTAKNDCSTRDDGDHCSISECCAMPTCSSWTDASNEPLQCNAGQRRSADDDYHCLGPECSAKDCCRMSCAIVMNNRSLSCDEGFMRRSATDWHDPFRDGDTSDASVKKECCSRTCPMVMANMSLDCPSGTVQRDDAADAFAAGSSADDITGICCLKTCHIVLQEKSITCDDLLLPRGDKDYFQPPFEDEGASWHESMDTDGIKSACCLSSCFSVFSQKRI